MAFACFEGRDAWKWASDGLALGLTVTSGPPKNTCRHTLPRSGGPIIHMPPQKSLQVLGKERVPKSPVGSLRRVADYMYVFVKWNAHFSWRARESAHSSVFRTHSSHVCLSARIPTFAEPDIHSLSQAIQAVRED